MKNSEGLAASSTVLGWVLSGPPSIESSVSTNCFETHSMRCDIESLGAESDSILRNDLNKFWSVENIESSDDCVIHKFEKEIVHNGERYVTKLPFKPGHEVLPDNFNVCEKRLKRLKKKLISENLVERYDKIFKEYEENKIIEKVSDDKIAKEPGLVHYLPHRPVVRNDKETTKIRAVFDVSCASNGPSLNECLYSGPNLLSKIFDILLRFRFNFVGILADIKQAFLNIQISEEHRDFLRFFWFENINSKDDEITIIYRFLRVVFGVTSSPFLLNATIRHHLNKYLQNEKEFVEKILEELYVDDVTSGTENIEKGKEFYNKAKFMCLEAGFDLRKWTTNNNELQNYFDSKENNENKITKPDDITYSEEQFGTPSNDFKKVLGVE